MKFDRPARLKVRGEPGLVRDPSSNAILASDLEAKRAFLEQQKKEMAMSALPNKVEELSKQMDEIRSMLASMMEKMQDLSLNTGTSLNK